MDNGRSMQGNNKLKAAEIFMMWLTPLTYLPSCYVQSLLTPPVNQPQALSRAGTVRLFTFLPLHLHQRGSLSLPSCSATLHQCWIALLHTFANSSPILNHTLVHIPPFSLPGFLDHSLLLLLSPAPSLAIRPSGFC